MTPLWLPWLCWPVFGVKIDVSEKPAGPKSGRLVGAGIEDVNNELYGGLYSQMISGESFEEVADTSGVSGAHFHEIIPAGPRNKWPHHRLRPTWSRMGQGGSFRTSKESTHGHQSQFISDGAIVNYGLGQQGMSFVAGKDYEGVLWVKPMGSASVTLSLLVNDTLAGTETWPLPKVSQWHRFSFQLKANRSSECRVWQRKDVPWKGSLASCTNTKETPQGCYLCSGGFQISVQGSVLVDYVLLQPGPWGRFHDLPVRKDVAEAMFQTSGWQVLRLGGSMCNVEGYRWKQFRGDVRAPYHGWWHPVASSAFRLFEVLELCEAGEVECVLTLNNEETPEDMADLLEYCFGSTQTTWGALRAADGRKEPYKMFSFEIGNEQKLDMLLVQQVEAISKAMKQRAEDLKLPMPQLVVGQNIETQLNFEGEGRAITSAMLEVLKPYTSAWDAHIGGDHFEDVDTFKKLLDVSSSFFQHVGKTKMVVFEENGFRHDLLRALNHARFNLAASYQGDFLLMNTAANGLQVFNQNDNGWDQGQIMMTPDKVWLSPFGWSQSMLSKHMKDFDVPLKLKITDGKEKLEVGAYRSAKGVGLRIVHWEGEEEEVTIQLRWHASNPVATAEILTANALDVVNPPADPELVKPQAFPVQLHQAEVLTLKLLLPGYAFVTVSVEEGTSKGRLRGHSAQMLKLQS